MIHERVNFKASRNAPNPIEVMYWIDLTTDPTGGIIKTHNGTKWEVISGKGESVDLSDIIQDITTLQNNKVDKVSGKALSTNDYTTVEKTKLTGIANNANNTTIVDNLTSTTTSSALSAAQGKILNDKIVALTARVTTLEAKP